MTPAADIDAALAPVLRSGSRFRVLSVVCPNQHQLAAVYRTALGLIAVSKSRSVAGEVEFGQEPPPADDHDGGLRHRDRTTRCLLADRGPRPVIAQCRCQHVGLPTAWLLEQIEAGKRRALWSTPATRAD